MITNTTATAIPVPTHEEAAAQGEQEYAALVAMLRSLMPADWARRTECPGWTVREMVAHITGAAEEAVRPSVLARHMVLARSRDRKLPTVDSLSAQQIADRAGRSPEELLTELERLAALAPRKRARVPGLVRGARLPASVGAPESRDTMAYLLDVIYNRDVWMHRADIARATDCAMPGSDAEAAVVAQIVRDLSRTWDGMPFTLTLTGRCPGTWQVGTGATDGGTVTVDTVALCRLLSGRRDETDPAYDGPDSGVVDRLRATRILF